jgi:hypothetical protein
LHLLPGYSSPTPQKGAISLWEVSIISNTMGDTVFEEIRAVSYNIRKTWGRFDEFLAAGASEYDIIAIQEPSMHCNRHGESYGLQHWP